MKDITTELSTVPGLWVRASRVDRPPQEVDTTWLTLKRSISASRIATSSSLVTRRWSGLCGRELPENGRSNITTLKCSARQRLVRAKAVVVAMAPLTSNTVLRCGSLPNCSTYTQ